MLIFRNAKGVSYMIRERLVTPVLLTWDLGNFGRMHRLLSWEVWFFVHCVIKRIVDHVYRRYIYARTRLRLWLPKAR